MISKKIESAQQTILEFKFSAIITAAIYDYGLDLTNKLISTSSSGQRHFDLI